ncbi:MAG TPA: hypothetical protein VLF63_01190, partial [Patescibacteria group bacterium]|nr:hypothetical protein [Patescibacteria group bacterium]
MKIKLLLNKYFFNKNDQFKYITSTLVVIIVAVIGVILLTGSHAAGPFVSVNSDTGTIANGATVQSSSNVSDGHYVVLNNATTSSGAVVPANPTGPATPSGGWHLAFGDAFGAPFGSGAGQDNFWALLTTNKSVNGEEAFSPSQDQVDSNGLHINLNYSPNHNGNGDGVNYVSGNMRTYPDAPHQTLFKYGNGETWVWECDCKLPVIAGGGMDPAWWSYGISADQEIDFFEEWGWGCTPLPNCVRTGMPVFVHSVDESQLIFGQFDPSAAYHKYTTILYPNNTFSEYIDGKLQTCATSTGFAGNCSGVTGPATNFSTSQMMKLILTFDYKLATSYFTSGKYTFDVRSVGMYIDQAHATSTTPGQGNGPDITGAGIAP